MNKLLSAINSADQATLGRLSRMASSPELGSEHRIPKRIIQTGKTIDQPLRCKAMMSNIRLLHPDFEYRFFDNQAVDSFIDEEFPQYRKTFYSFRFPIQRYDFFRYLAVFRYGGFYFDTDILLASSVSKLLDSGCVFPFEGLTLSRFLRNRGMDWEIGNYAFGAVAGHPFLAAVIENCLRAQREPEWAALMWRDAPLFYRSELEVLNTTGPGLLSRTLVENPELANTVRVLFPDDVCEETTWNRFGDIGVHFMEASWRKKGSHILRRLAQRWENRQLQHFLKESRHLGKTRQVKTAASPPVQPRPGQLSPIAARVQGKFQRTAARLLSRRPFAIKPRVPLISFTFDDFPRSALMTGGTILQSFGLAGTYYASLGLVGKRIDTGDLMRAEDIKALVAQGHELGCHTYMHCDAWKTEPSAFGKAIEENRQALEGILPGATFKSLSYPIGVPRPKTKEITSRHFSCSRGGGQTFNVGETDLNFLSAYFIEQNRDDPDAIKKIIDENSVARGWLIFATHDVSDDPTRWGCTPGLFKEIVEYSVNSGARILPVYEAFQLIRSE